MSTETPKSEIQREIEAHAERDGWTPEAKALLGAAALHQRIGDLERELCRVTEERDKETWRVGQAEQELAKVRAERDAALRRVEEAEKALDYYRSAFLKRRPNWLPSSVLVLKEVRADYPMGDAYLPVSTGETECRSNLLGAVSVVNANGIEIGLRPDEFEVIGWKPARLDAAEKGGGK